MWIIFGFVAIWHDLEWKLVLWGLLNAGFFVVEVCVLSFVLQALFITSIRLSVNRVRRHRSTR